MAQVTTIENPAAPLVQGPARLPVNYGLFSVLGFDTPSTPYWQNGARWEQLVSDEVGIIGQPICETVDNEDQPVLTPGLPKQFQSGVHDYDYATAFTVYGSYKCSPIGNDLAYAQDVAVQRLQLLEERAVEKALWAGAVNTAHTFDTLTALTSVDADDLLEAVALLEQHIADEYGALGVLHMNRYVGTKVDKLVGLDYRGGRAYTKLGTPVVIGQGYGSDAIVATGPMFGLRDDIIQPTSRTGDLLDRGNNDLYGLAERTYLVGYDSTPATKITLTSATP